MLDPHMKDGLHEWRDGRRLIKEGDRLYIEGTNTLAGRCVVRHNYKLFVNVYPSSSVVTMGTCVRNFVRFTGCTFGEAIKCATYNPAK